MSTDAPLLEVVDLHGGYTRGTEVLKGIDMALPRSARIAVMGRNGMGKTLLARMLIGLNRPGSGTIRFDGQDITSLPAHRVSRLGIAYVPQGREIFGDLSVDENLRMGAIGHGGHDEDQRQRLLDWFPILAERAAQQAGTLSGGQAQQLAVARALMSQPRVLILDEPSEGIQPNIVHSLGETLAQICDAEGLTVLLVEQNFDLVEVLAREVLFIENGRVTAREAVATLSADPQRIAQHMGL